MAGGVIEEGWGVGEAKRERVAAETSDWNFSFFATKSVSQFTCCYSIGNSSQSVDIYLHHSAPVFTD